MSSSVQLSTVEDTSSFQAPKDKKERASREKDERAEAPRASSSTRPATYGSRMGSTSSSLNYTIPQAPQLSTHQSRNTRKALLVAKAMRESQKLQEKYDIERTQLRNELEYSVQKRRQDGIKHHQEMLMDWRRKLEKSPFLVDQVAESERIDEEHRVKVQEEARRQKIFEARKDKIKTEIILRALAESSELDNLRQEKRLIALEEKKLKARRDVERKMAAHANLVEMDQERLDRRRQREAHAALQQQRFAQANADLERRRELLQHKLALKSAVVGSRGSAGFGDTQ